MLSKRYIHVKDVDVDAQCGGLVRLHKTKTKIPRLRV